MQLPQVIVISLKDSNGNPISGADLSVNLRGIKNYTTNEDGQVLINIAKLYPKTYNAMITYAGSDNFNGSTGSAKVTVNKITSTIIAKSPTFKLNQNIKKYTITLKYLSGKLIANKKVTAPTIYHDFLIQRLRLQRGRDTAHHVDVLIGNCGAVGKLQLP